MKTTARLSIVCADGETAERLRSVLAPDSGAPTRGLSIELSMSGTRVIFNATSASPSTSISTCLGVLRDAALFQEVWLLTSGGDARVQRASGIA